MSAPLAQHSIGAVAVELHGTGTPRSHRTSPSLFNQVAYGHSKARMTRRARRAGTIDDSVNLATMKYTRGEGEAKKIRYVTTRSNPKTNEHSKDVLARLSKHPLLKGWNAEWLYSEREPCGKGAGMKNCREGALRQLKVPKDKVHYSFPYPSRFDCGDSTSRAHGARNASAVAMKKALAEHKQDDDSAAESENDYKVMTEADFPAPRPSRRTRSRGKVISPPPAAESEEVESEADFPRPSGTSKRKRKRERTAGSSSGSGSSGAEGGAASGLATTRTSARVRGKKAARR